MFFASEPGVFCAFWLGNVLRATTACHFSSLIWPAGSAPAASASLLFNPLEPQIIGKTQCFATFLPFRAPGSSFFWDPLFFDLLSSSLFFSDSSHLCFSSADIVGSLTSKLPSIVYIYIWNIYEYPLIIHRWSTKTDLKSSGCCRKKKNGLRKNTRAPNGIELCSFVVSASGQCGSFDSRRLCRANAVWRFQQISVQTASSQSQTTWIVTELALCILTTTTFFFIISIVSIPVQVGTSSILISLLWWGLWSLHLCVIANPSIVGTMPWVLFKPLPFAKEAGIKTTRIYKNLSESLKLCKNL